MPTDFEPNSIIEMLTLQETADQVITALANKDFATLAGFVSPEIGVRFSPYAYVSSDQVVFFPNDIAVLFDSSQIYSWGFYDGSGEPIDLTFAEYYAEFIYSADFAYAEATAENERLGQGNSISNITEFYPDSQYIEYYFSGFDPQYAGMDWQSLRLVFTQHDDIWYLVGIIHDEWTI